MSPKGGALLREKNGTKPSGQSTLINSYCTPIFYTKQQEFSSPLYKLFTCFEIHDARTQWEDKSQLKSMLYILEAKRIISIDSMGSISSLKKNIIHSN